MESLNIVIDEDFNYMCLDVLNENKLKQSIDICLNWLRNNFIDIYTKITKKQINYNVDTNKFLINLVCYLRNRMSSMKYLSKIDFASLYIEKKLTRTNLLNKEFYKRSNFDYIKKSSQYPQKSTSIGSGSGGIISYDEFIYIYKQLCDMYGGIPYLKIDESEYISIYDLFRNIIFS
jgi:hypothetical protein